MTNLSYQFIVKESDATKAFTAEYHEDIVKELDELRNKLEVMYGVVARETGLSFRERVAQTNYIGVMCNEIMMFELCAFKTFQSEVQEFYNEFFFDREDGYKEATPDDKLGQLLIRIVREFYQDHPNLLIVSMVPINMTGTFGFVVIPKDMNPLATGTV